MYARVVSSCSCRRRATEVYFHMYDAAQAAASLTVGTLARVILRVSGCGLERPREATLTKETVEKGDQDEHHMMIIT